RSGDAMPEEPFVGRLRERVEALAVARVPELLRAVVGAAGDRVAGMVSA
ncbi:MAG: hypothetical protein RJA69_1134, partial [Pseudomonadota bacterium]